jgi:hypothetical protein
MVVISRISGGSPVIVGSVVGSIAGSIVGSVGMVTVGSGLGEAAQAVSMNTRKINILRKLTPPVMVD